MRIFLTLLLCSTWMIGQSKISDNQLRTPPPLNCNDTTTSGTTQTCSTTPSFTPAAKDCVVYNTTTTNTGALTLNVNSQGAKAVQKWLGTALVAGDVVANKPQLACYDGTNWQLSTIGNAPSSGSGTVTSVTCNAGLTGGAITTSGTCALSTSGTGATGMILLEEHTASTSAELDFTTCLSSTYSTYKLIIDTLTPATNAVAIELQYSGNGGSTYDTGTNYAWSKQYNSAEINDNGATKTSGDVGWVLGGTDVSNSTTYPGLNGWVELYGVNSATVNKVGTYYLAYTNSTPATYQIGGAYVYKATPAVVNAFRYKATSGNLASGTVRCYGMTK